MAHSGISTFHGPCGHTETHPMIRSLHLCYLGFITDHPQKLHYSILIPWIHKTLVTIGHNRFNRYLQHESSLWRVFERLKPNVRSIMTRSPSHLLLKSKTGSWLDSLKEEARANRKLSRPWYGPYWVESNSQTGVVAVKVYFPRRDQSRFLHTEWQGSHRTFNQAITGTVTAGRVLDIHPSGWISWCHHTLNSQTLETNQLMDPQSIEQD